MWVKLRVPNATSINIHQHPSTPCNGCICFSDLFWQHQRSILLQRGALALKEHPDKAFLSISAMLKDTDPDLQTDAIGVRMCHALPVCLQAGIENKERFQEIQEA